MIRTYMDFEEKLTGIDDIREQEKVILEEFKIYANPSYVYLKGQITISLEGGKKFQLILHQWQYPLIC